MNSGSFSGEYSRICIDHPVADVALVFCRTADLLQITAVLLNERHAVADLPLDKSAEACRHAQEICRFLDGTSRELKHLPLSFVPFTDFQKKVLCAARSIEWGRTVSYAQLACMAGHPRAVRAAASVMACNPYPLIIPCHRVVRADGSLGGFMGKMDGAEVELKRRLVERERE